MPQCGAALHGIVRGLRWKTTNACTRDPNRIVVTTVGGVSNRWYTSTTHCRTHTYERPFVCLVCQNRTGPSGSAEALLQELKHATSYYLPAGEETAWGWRERTGTVAGAVVAADIGPDDDNSSILASETVLFL